MFLQINKRKQLWNHLQGISSFLLVRGFYDADFLVAQTSLMINNILHRRPLEFRIHSHKILLQILTVKIHSVCTKKKTDKDLTSSRFFAASFPHCCKHSGFLPVPRIATCRFLPVPRIASCRCALNIAVGVMSSEGGGSRIFAGGCRLTFNPFTVTCAGASSATF